MKNRQKITITQPATPEQWQQYNRLRFEVLRKPWGQPLGSEKIEDDATATHAMAIDAAGRVVGVARIHFTEPQVAQLRTMAVAPEVQGQGVGRQIVQYLEEQARQQGATKMLLEARENAVEFYRALGYEVTKPSYLLFGQIQHYTMTKELMNEPQDNRHEKGWQLLSPHGLLLAGGIVVAGAALLLLSGLGKKQKPLETVERVDLTRYMGRWYEIARYPNRFEKGCHCVTADYRQHPDGYVEVLNSCRKNGPEGELETAKGKAFVVEGSQNAKLRVQFQWPFRGDYWIIDLADDYRYAVVSNPDRDSLWILSRSPQMLPIDYEVVIERLKARGYDLTQLIFTDQSCF